jgi:hypothetical protein
MGDPTQLTIAVIGLVAALVTLAASVVEITHKRDVKGGAAAPRGNRKRAGWLFAAGLTLAALSVVAPYVVLPMIMAGRPLADIRSPKAGERINRPQAVEVHLNRRVPDNETVWLGYQNEQGGPFIVQASQCQAIGERLDCGPLYVGQDKNDASEFRIFTATADTSATVDLSRHASSARPGDNVKHDILPVGTKLISEERHITLAR